MHLGNLAYGQIKITISIVRRVQVLFYMMPTSSSHDGLFTYVDNDFDVSVIQNIDFLTIWEGLFLELTHRSR